MRAPGPAPDDVIEEIVENLSPLKRGQTRAAVTEIVNRQLKVLRGLASPVGPPSKQKSPRSQWSLMDQISDQKENREHAKKLNKALQQVEEFLAKAPSVLAWSLFDPLPPM